MPTNSNPLVSVGVTTYRRPEGLAKVLDGLLGQTYRDLEIIVSDNCSSMPEVDEVLEHFTSRDNRIRVFKQKINIGMQPNHTFVARQSTGTFFLWLHDDDVIPDNYIERCVERFSDSPQIDLVGPRADAYFDGQFWFTYKNHSNVGETVYVRLRNLIPIGYSEPSAFQQYIFGVFRREALADCIWKDDQYYYKETFSLFFRISEKGFIHLADDVRLKKFNFEVDVKKWREAKYVDKPLKYKVAGDKIEELIPRTLNIFSTVTKSQHLNTSEKFRLLVLCIYHFSLALFASPIPLWRRIVQLPFRLARKVKHVMRRLPGLLR